MKPLVPRTAERPAEAPVTFDDAVLKRPYVPLPPPLSDPWNTQSSAQAYGRITEYSWYQGLIESMVDFLPEVEPGRLVIDLGCGTGCGTHALARRYGPDVPVAGVDNARAQVDFARSKNSRGRGVEFYEGDVTSLRMFMMLCPQMVVAFNSAHLIGPTEAVLCGVSPVLERGGVFAFCTPYSTAMHRTPQARKFSNFIIQEIRNKLIQEFPLEMRMASNPLPGCNTSFTPIFHTDVGLLETEMKAGGFKLEKQALYAVDVPSSAMIDLLVTPGLGQEIIPPSIPEFMRREIIKSILDYYGVDSFARNWCFAVGRKK